MSAPFPRTRLHLHPLMQREKGRAWQQVKERERERLPGVSYEGGESRRRMAKNQAEKKAVKQHNQWLRLNQVKWKYTRVYGHKYVCTPWQKATSIKKCLPPIDVQELICTNLDPIQHLWNKLRWRMRVRLQKSDLRALLTCRSQMVPASHFIKVCHSQIAKTFMCPKGV